MIEVELGFQPTEEELKAFLEDANFLRDETHSDNYYDYPDYRLFNNKVWLRDRDGSYELKIGKGKQAKEEVVDKKEIEKYFETDNLGQFIKKNLVLVTSWHTNRSKYKMGEFNIEVDKLDFGYKLCEIELMVSEDDMYVAREKIKTLARTYGFAERKAPSKREEYFRIVKPEVYKELYGE